MKKILLFIFALAAVIACDKEASHILSSGKMEDVLYDYHLAQAMIEELGADDRDKLSQAYIDAVFEKHNITEAEFDSSLVYYNRDAVTLEKIYKNIQERFEQENQSLALTTGNDIMTAMTQNGDTANIWNASHLIVLRSKNGLNHESFTIKADSTFHREDKFTFVCYPIIITENQSNPDYFIQIGLTITYKDGTTSGTSMRASSNRNMQLYLSAQKDKDISSVSGFFYLNGNTQERNLALISSIGLIRMHTKVEEIKPVVADSLNKDSVSTEVPKLHQKRLTPEELRELNQSDNHIKIKAAPDVRTPNSIGPRRKVIRNSQPARPVQSGRRP